MSVKNEQVAGLNLGVMRHIVQSRGLIPIQPRAGVTFYPGSIVAHRVGSNLAEVPLAATPRTDLVALGVFVGNAPFTASSTADANGGAVDTTVNPQGNPQSVTVQPFGPTGWFATGAGADQITAQMIDQPCFLADDGTVNATDGGGTLSFAGWVYDVRASDGRVAVRNDEAARVLYELYSAGQGAGGGSPPNKARAMVTTLHAYAGSLTGQLTSTATGAFGTQDGVSDLKVNDVVFIPPVISNLADIGDAGPWEISVLGGTGVKWVLTRPAWYAHGAALGINRTIEIGPEGTGQYAGMAWRSFAAPGTTVDTAGATTDPAWFPRQYAFSQTIGGGGSSTADTAAYIRDVKRISAVNCTSAHAFWASTLTAQSSSAGVITQGSLAFTGTASDVIKGVAQNF